MDVIHEADDGSTTVLANEVERADTVFEKARGLMFRRDFPPDRALVFSFDRSSRRSVHTCFVPFAIDVIWLEDERVTKCRRFRPWCDLSWGHADTILEVAAGVATEVQPGDQIRIRDQPKRE